MPLTQDRQNYKPFEYPWAYSAWSTQQKIHWLPSEVSFADDIKDWSTKLQEDEKRLLTFVFRFFTQSDIEVNNCYMKKYMNVFGPPEVQMMLSAFSNMETIHIDAYSHLIDTLGMPESEYCAFLEYKEMKDKYDFMKKARSSKDIAVTLATFGGFIEGVQLFASFAMLLNFQRFGIMRGMGQIIAWSIRDETLHCNSIIKLFHEFIKENSHIDKSAVNKKIIKNCKKIVAQEEKFIDLAFGVASIRGIKKLDIKKYVKYIANKRLSQLGIDPIYKLQENPIPWIEDIVNGVEFANFFDSRVTEYSKGATGGNWEDVF